MDINPASAGSSQPAQGGTLGREQEPQSQQPPPPPLLASQGETAQSQTSHLTQQQQQQDNNIRETTEQQHQPEQQQQQEPEEQPASPPLPPKHTAVTPGPRATRLQEVFADRLARTLDRIGWANFAACYPTVAARAPATLRFVQRQMVERLGGQCRKEFEAVLANRNVVPRLNELESLVSDAARRKAEARARDGEDAIPPVPPHLLPAPAILAAHLAPHLAAQHAQLSGRLASVQAQNARLFAEIGAQRAEAASLLAAVQKVLADVDGAAGLLLARGGEGESGDGGVGGGGLADEMAEEARTVEVEMAGV